MIIHEGLYTRVLGAKGKGLRETYPMINDEGKKRTIETMVSKIRIRENDKKNKRKTIHKLL
jgi:hypothetical protein